MDLSSAVSKQSEAPVDQSAELPKSVSVAGGSAVGGWDHLKVLIAAKKSGIEDVRTIKYVAFDGGGEAVTAAAATEGKRW